MKTNKELLNYLSSVASGTLAPRIKGPVLDVRVSSDNCLVEVTIGRSSFILDEKEYLRRYVSYICKVLTVHEITLSLIGHGEKWLLDPKSDDWIKIT